MATTGKIYAACTARHQHFATLAMSSYLLFRARPEWGPSEQTGVNICALIQYKHLGFQSTVNDTQTRYFIQASLADGLSWVLLY